MVGFTRETKEVIFFNENVNDRLCQAHCIENQYDGIVEQCHFRDYNLPLRIKPLTRTEMDGNLLN